MHKPIATTITALVLVGFWATPSFAQPSRAITGVVTDAEGGAALEGATVAVKDNPEVSATTAADGSFKIAKAPRTEVILQVTGTDYASAELKIGAGRSAAIIAVTLVKTPPPPTRVVTGIVRDSATGAAIVGASVKVQGTELGAVSDADGLFSISGVAVASVVLEVSSSEHNASAATVAANQAAIKLAMNPRVAAPPPPVEPTSRTVGGVVTETSTGDPVIGATVILIETGEAAITDETGAFSFADVALTAVTITVEAVGFKAALVPAPEGVNDVQASLQFDAGEEIIIQGRAPVIVKQNLAHGASVVESEDLTRVSSGHISDALQGKISGANLQANGGAPGGGAQLRLRGVSTINGQASPLYVIDGVIISNIAISSGANAITSASAGGNPSAQDNPVNRIADINPNDIANIEILKGASAAALYGSKAANGVVVITTKRGGGTGGGGVRANFTQRFGFSQISNTLGSREFTSVQEVMDAFGDSAVIVDSFQAGRVFDHEKEITQSSLATETIASLSGGSPDATYFGSLLVRHEPGIVKGTGYDKQSGRIGVNYQVGERIQVGFNGSLVHANAERGLSNNDNSGTSNYMVLTFTPSFFDLNPVNGVFPENPFVGSGTNPQQTVELLENDEDVWRFIGGINTNVKVWNDETSAITAQGNFGVDRFQQKNVIIAPPELFFEDADGLPGTSIDGSSNNLNWNFGGSALWTFMPASETFKSALTAGFSFESTELTTVTVIAQNLVAGQPNVDSGSAIRANETRTKTRDQGVFVQEEVALLDETLSLLVGLLAERSSLNGDVDEFFLFPKVAATYEIKLPALEENVELLRVRAAYGEAGNRPNFGNKFTSLNGTNTIDGNSGLVGGNVAGDPGIKPERQREFEVGLDGVLTDQRASIELTAYQRNISDLLLQRTLAPSTGQRTQFFNGGSMRNRGLEAALQVLPVVDPLEWTSRFIFTINRSQITDLPVEPFVITNAGFGAGLGTYQIEEGSSATQLVDGMLNNIGDGEPDFRFGFSNNVKYKQFGFTSLVDWQQGSKIVNLTRLLADFGQVSPDYVGTGEDRLASFSAGDISPYVEDGTFIKLREVSVYWDAPTAWASSASLDTLRFSLSGRNLYTITDYSGLDPEVSNFGNQPIGRNFDVAPYPPSRSFWFSVDAGF